MNTMETTNHFAALAAINVNSKTEKKNGLTYLSWAWAVDQLSGAILAQAGSLVSQYGGTRQ
jgi:hypothetical protein